MQSANSYQKSVAVEAVKALKLKPPPLVQMVNGVVVVPNGFTPIPGHENRYAIDEDGRVFSHMRKRLMSLTPTDAGYLAVKLFTTGEKEGQKTLVQYLMVRTFMPNFPVGSLVDHANRCRSDNKVTNLRPATFREQKRNSSAVKQHNRTLFRGVILKNKHDKCWVASIRTDCGKKKWGHYFTTDREAALEYDEMAVEFHGAFAVTNKSLGLL